MRFVLFYHSFTSCWNHGNVHFLRGVTRALIARGHQVTIYEPADSWSRVNALREPHGAAILEECAQLVPGADIRSYTLSTIDLDRALDGADVVIVHEWNDPMLLRRIADRRVRGGRFLLLFHDTHHRAASGPHELNRLRLDACDLVLVFGEVLRQRYLANGWGRKVATWHEAADTDLFSPQPNVTREADLSGLAIGATTSGIASSRNFSPGRSLRPGFRADSTACAIRCRCWRGCRISVSIIGDGSPITALRALLRPRASRCMCRGGPMWKRFRGFRPFACSRRSPAVLP